MAENHEHHDEVRVEESSLSNSGIFAFVAITAVVFFGSAGTLLSLAPRVVESFHNDRDTGAAEFVSQRADQENHLASYGYVDKAKGIVHIPVDVAMQKVVEEAKK